MQDTTKYNKDLVSKRFLYAVSSMVVLSLLVVFSADRGLCGGFNGSITRTVRSEIKKLKDDGINVKLLMVGKKSADALNREFGDLFVEKIDGNSANPNYTDAEVLAARRTVTSLGIEADRLINIAMKTKRHR